MDGERKGPAKREKLEPGTDLLGPIVFDRIRRYMDDSSDKASHFSLMALVDENCEA